MRDRRGLDTLVVASVNYASSGLVTALTYDLISTCSLYRETKAYVFRGEYSRKAET